MSSSSSSSSSSHPSHHFIPEDAVQLPSNFDVPASSNAKQAAKDILYGGIAGMVAKLWEHPFDLIKVRLQSQPTDRPPSFNGPWDCLKKTVKGEGAAGLYRGISMPVFGSILENATLFLIYNQSRFALLSSYHYFRSSSSPLSSFSSSSSSSSIPSKDPFVLTTLLPGALAGCCASFVLTPVELIKCRMQVQGQVLAEREAEEAAKTIANAKVKAKASTVVNGSGGGGTSNLGAIKPSPTSQSPIRIASSSSSSSFTSSSRFHHPPVRWSTTASIPARTKPPGPLQMFKETIKTDGFRGLWLGQTGTLIRETGGTGVWFSCYELATKFCINLRQRENNNTTITKDDLSSLELMLSGAFAGVFYNVSFFPADCVKSAVQTEQELSQLSRSPLSSSSSSQLQQQQSHQIPPRTFIQVGKEIYKTRGIKGLYSGCGITILRSAPSSAMIFWIYETLRVWGEGKNKKNGSGSGIDDEKKMALE